MGCDRPESWLVTSHRPFELEEPAGEAQTALTLHGWRTLPEVAELEAFRQCVVAKVGHSLKIHRPPLIFSKRAQQVPVATCKPKASLKSVQVESLQSQIEHRLRKPMLYRQI
ncbi:hypothetical protein ACGF3C_25245 [Micromonospora sp. NPDC047762]|uniref:hypothetical protein n=1 Tax=Micromonospora sp. NPDC047762 TaxID=3364255 RepID=UPI003713E8F8